MKVFERLRQGKVSGIILRIAGILSALAVPALCYYFIELLNFYNRGGIEGFVSWRGQLIAFALVAFCLIYGIILLLVGRGWIAALVCSGAAVVFGLTNFFKHALTGDNFFPWDIVEQTGNMGELMSFLSVKLPSEAVVVLILFAVLFAVQLVSGIRLRWRFRFRAPVAVLLLTVCILPFKTDSGAKLLLSAADLRMEDAFLQDSNYASNGFFGAFTVNLMSMNVRMPDGYSEEAVTELMSGYSDTPARDGFSSPDIIVILSESFWDPRQLPGTEISANPLECFDEITSREGTISGYIYQTAMGGGTVRPEFDILTGLTTDGLPSGSTPWQYVTERIPTFVSLFDDLGYRTVADHPYLPSFYRRVETYPSIGFDEMYFAYDLLELGDLGLLDYTETGKQISDYTFVESIKYFLDQSGSDPSFIFGISMENHQPYLNKYSGDEISVYTENLSLDSEALEALGNYVQGVLDADRALGELISYIDGRERDTMLVYFGDHLPTLGTNFSAYYESGYFDSPLTDEQTLAKQRTPFLIYSNFELGESDIVKTGTGNELSSYNLLNAAAELIGAPRTAYMNYLSDYYATVPYYNARLPVTLTDEQKKMSDAHLIFTYDLLCGEKYLLRTEE